MFALASFFIDFEPLHCKRESYFHNLTLKNNTSRYLQVNPILWTQTFGNILAFIVMWRMNAVFHVKKSSSIEEKNHKFGQIEKWIITNINHCQFWFTEEHGDTPAALTSQLMQNPQILADLQHRLGSMVGVSSGYIQRYVGSTAVQ